MQEGVLTRSTELVDMCLHLIVLLLFLLAQTLSGQSCCFTFMVPFSMLCCYYMVHFLVSPTLFQDGHGGVRAHLAFLSLAGTTGNRHTYVLYPFIDRFTWPP